MLGSHLVIRALARRGHAVMLLEAFDQPRPLVGKHPLVLGDARLVEERKGRE